MRAVLLAFVVGSFMVLGSSADECSKGESVWCGSLRQAIKCSAVNHCKSTVWKNEIPTEDSSDVCQFCEATVKDIVDMIEQNKSREFIEKFLTNVCDLIPSRATSLECKILVKEGLPFIMELIQEKIDPKIICGFLGLCGNQFSMAPTSGTTSTIAQNIHDNDIHFTEDDKKEDSLCDECIDFVTKAREALLSKETEKKVVDFVENTICKLLIIGSDKCKHLTEKVIPQIFDSLRKTFDPKKVCSIFCKYLGQWSKKDERLRSMLSSLNSKQSDVVECEVCQTVVKIFLHLLENTYVQDEFNNFLSQHFCPIMGTDPTECTRMLPFVSTLLKKLAGDVDPAALCQSVHLCKKTNGLKFVPSEVDDVSEISNFFAKEEKNLGLSVGSLKCSFCKVVVGRLEDHVGFNRTEEMIIKTLDSVCDKFKVYKSQCRMFVESQLRQYVKMLVLDATPEYFCEEVHMCPHHKAAIDVSSDKCQTCEIVAQYLESLPETGSSVEEIQSLVSKVCSMLPKSGRPICDSMIDEYGGLLIHYILELHTPKDYCKFIRLCPASQVRNGLKFVPLEVSDASDVSTLFDKEEKSLGLSVGSLKCSFCKVVVGKLEDRVGFNRTEEMIIKTLDSVCDKFKVYKSQCRMFVESQLRQYVKMLVLDVTPEFVCEEVHMCPHHKAAIDVSSDKCQTCEIVVQYLESLLEMGASVEVIESLVSKVCTLLPKSAQPTCNSMIKEYGSLLIHYIIELASPKDFCQFINLCPTSQVSKVQQHYRCIAGPEFWCASQENARLCQAEDHCRRFAWA